MNKRHYIFYMSKDILVNKFAEELRKPPPRIDVADDEDAPF